MSSSNDNNNNSNNKRSITEEYKDNDPPKKKARKQKFPLKLQINPKDLAIKPYDFTEKQCADTHSFLWASLPFAKQLILSGDCASSHASIVTNIALKNNWQHTNNALALGVSSMMEAAVFDLLSGEDGIISTVLTSGLKLLSPFSFKLQNHPMTLRIFGCYISDHVETKITRTGTIDPLIELILSKSGFTVIGKNKCFAIAKERISSLNFKFRKPILKLSGINIKDVKCNEGEDLYEQFVSHVEDIAFGFDSKLIWKPKRNETKQKEHDILDVLLEERQKRRCYILAMATLKQHKAEVLKTWKELEKKRKEALEMEAMELDQQAQAQT